MLLARNRRLWIQALLVAVACAACSAGVPSQDCWRFLYSESSTAPTSRAESRPPDTEVFLLPDEVILRAPGVGAVVYDFATRRIRMYDLPNHSLASDHSMFGYISFRAFEIRNRSMLGSIFEGAGLKGKDSPLRLLDAETELGVELPEKRRTIITKPEGNSFVYEADSTRLARCTFESGSLPAPLAKRLSSFLAYRCRVHPAVRRAIVAQNRLPRRIETSVVEPGTKVVKDLIIEFKQHSKSFRPGLPRQRARLATDAEVLDLMGAILGEACTRKRLPPTELIAFSDKAMKEKRYLDAFLGIIEVGWIDDSKVPTDRLKAIMAAGADDPHLKTYLEAMKAKDPGETRRLVQSIPRGELLHAYVLDVNEAATYHAQRRAKEGIEAYERALKAQPWTAGPWKDLGDLFSASFNFRAWDCYDIARAVCPKHSMLKGVNEMERKLASDFPDFF
jgi:hypothetical protein